ncbi:MAG: hypothetical protein QMD22_10000 [archaeon]|nr:hypothetical protein [archaeon]
MLTSSRDFELILPELIANPVAYGLSLDRNVVIPVDTELRWKVDDT